MPWRDAFEPTPMTRVAVVAPGERLRTVLVAVADAGLIELERLDGRPEGPVAETLERVRRENLASAPTGEAPDTARLGLAQPDLGDLEGSGRLAELVGEAELERYRAMATRRGDIAALAGWSPTASLPALATRLAPFGGAVVSLPAPRGATPPTLVDRRGVTGAFQPLVDTYATLPYADVNPAAFAGFAYVVMFGMMFGDVGHGVLLAAAGLLLATGRPVALARFRRLAPFVIGAGAASALFGLAFGELFGPTHVVPTLWIAPLDDPTTLLAVAVAAGAGLITISYVLGTVNRWRESGASGALVSTSGIAGTLVYLGFATIGLGWYFHTVEAIGAGIAIVVVGLALAYIGSRAKAARRLGGVMQAAVEVFDTVLRIGTNTVSFARLAAFGLTHAALCGVVWSATTGLWHRGPALWWAAIIIFLVGNAAAFALEGLVAGIQALRLEYYELFSRVFVTEGRPFRPWHIPTLPAKETPCSPG